MTVSQWLTIATKQLEAAGIGTARLDSLVLLEDCSGIDRAKLLAEPEHELSTKQRAQLKKVLNQRAKHVPIAYIRGRTEFYGREFVINPAVLEPRSESETMIELLKELATSDLRTENQHSSGLRRDARVCIADVGTGSGALGITAQLELPDSQVELLDIDPEALKVAKVNVDKFTLLIPVTKSDLLYGATQNNDILLCNLPYVPDDYQINLAALHEPRVAIFGGPDGLDLYRKLFDQIKMVVNKPLYILSESLPPQHETLTGIANESGYKLVTKEDFIQIFVCSR